MSPSEHDCCEPTREELEEQLRSALRGRAMWKNLAEAQRKVLMAIASTPKGEMHRARALKLRSLAASALSWTPGKAPE